MGAAMGSAGRQERLGVVFVHGFRSSAEMWSPLIASIDQDDGVKGVTALPFSYDTRLWQIAPVRRIPGFDTVADSLKEFLDTEAEHFDRLLLVCHSQGGLVAQRFLARMLAEGRGRDLARIRRVVLFACPNNGSQLALSLRRGLLSRNPQERRLRPLDQQIADTQRIVLRDIVNVREVTDRSCPIPFSVYAGETDNVVPPASALGTFPDTAVLPGDHSGIVRSPRAYSTLRRLLLTGAEAPSAVGPPTGAAAEPAPAPAAPATAGSVTIGPGSTPGPVEAAPESPPSAFPDTIDIVRVAEQVSDMDDPDFRRRVIGLVRGALEPEAGFSPAFRAHPRDHLLEIVERCQTHRLRAAALAAFRDAIGVLRPDDAATAALGAMIRDPE
ncbi:esterase/lipase family protein [Streptomyces sp. NPDC017546]|uniref:esterase/lipase family protein n=1 Tax=unclassified Streptomyces TaxID=2593676 RepID=UPI00235E0DD8|nr:alpha/beta fold hydrolase [Streptomyces sp. MMBL 11-1]